MSQSQLKLKDASFKEIAKVASDIIYQDKIEKKILSSVFQQQQKFFALMELHHQFY